MAYFYAHTWQRPDGSQFETCGVFDRPEEALVRLPRLEAGQHQLRLRAVELLRTVPQTAAEWMAQFKEPAGCQLP